MKKKHFKDFTLNHTYLKRSFEILFNNDVNNIEDFFLVGIVLKDGDIVVESPFITKIKTFLNIISQENFLSNYAPNLVNSDEIKWKQTIIDELSKSCSPIIEEMEKQFFSFTNEYLQVTDLSKMTVKEIQADLFMKLNEDIEC